MKNWLPDFQYTPPPLAFVTDPVTELENRIAHFFGAPYAVAVDSCTHGIELCLRYLEANYMNSPIHTYVSVPMLADKLNINLHWYSNEWKNYYCVFRDKKITKNLYGSLHQEIYDAAVYWEKDGFIKSEMGGNFMCLSFQHKKHLSLGRGGMILCPDQQSALQLKKMSYDGRLPNIPWREQDIDTMGYHYYMTPETAQLGLSKLDAAIATVPRQWTIEDWPDVSRFKVFNK